MFFVYCTLFVGACDHENDVVSVASARTWRYWAEDETVLCEGKPNSHKSDELTTRTACSLLHSIVIVLRGSVLLAQYLHVNPWTCWVS